MIDAQAILLFIVCLSRKKSVDLHNRSYEKSVIYWK